VVYGVYVLARIKREQAQLTNVLQAFSDRSADIAAAITALKPHESPLVTEPSDGA